MYIDKYNIKVIGQQYNSKKEKYDTQHGLTLGMSYSRALDKLGLYTFWTKHEKFINEHKLDEVDIIKKELREGKYNG